jgi:hypothetical protein
MFHFLILHIGTCVFSLSQSVYKFIFNIFNFSENILFCWLYPAFFSLVYAPVLVSFFILLYLITRCFSRFGMDA